MGEGEDNEMEVEGDEADGAKNLEKLIGMIGFGFSAEEEKEEGEKGSDYERVVRRISKRIKEQESP